MKSFIKFLFRLISFPFWAGLVLIALFYKFLYACYHYLIYGGELISYVKNDEKTIFQCYLLLRDNIQAINKNGKA